MDPKKIIAASEANQPRGNARDLLGKIPFFSNFDVRALERLAACAHERRTRRGEVLMRSGDPGHSMMVVSLGEVRVILRSFGGSQQIVNTLGPGAVFGEIALFDGKVRTADVVATTNGRVLIIERSALLRLIEEDPQFALHLILLLCTRLRSTLLQLESILFQDAGARLAANLLSLAQGSPPRHLDMTQAALGQLVGASREIINKRLRALKDAGIVSLSPGRVTLLDEFRLSQAIPGHVSTR